MSDLSAHVLEGLTAAAELQRSGDLEGARAAYRDLLNDPGTDDFDAVYVLHLLAVIVEDPQSKLDLNIESLQRAEVAGERFPAAMKASLLANVGYSHRALGDVAEARRWYLQAREAADQLPDDEYGRSIRDSAQQTLDALDREAEQSTAG
ncbi:MAG: hypothetical protein QOI61_1511 [Actinomycetota bacterium]